MQMGRPWGSSLNSHGTHRESPTEDTVGWGRAAHDAADSAFPDVEPKEPLFLDRPVGFVTYRWMLVVVGAIVGALMGWAVVVLVTPPDQELDFTRGGIVLFIGLPAGALVGGVVTGLILRRVRLNPFRHARRT